MFRGKKKARRKAAGGVSPYRPPGRNVFVAAFATSETVKVALRKGEDQRPERRMRSLGVSDEKEARELCIWLTRLGRERSIDPADAVGAPPEVIRIYYGITVEDLQRRMAERLTADGLHVTLGDLAATHPDGLDERNLETRDELRMRTLNLQVELGTRARDLNEAQARIAELEGRIQDLEGEVASLQSVAIKQAQAERVQRIPPISKLLPAYEKYSKAKCTSRDAATTAVSRARKWYESLPDGVKKLPVSEIKPEHVNQFIENLGGGRRQKSRQYGWQISVGAFLNWAARRFDFPSPMIKIRKVSKLELDRERGGIQWHSREEVEEVIGENESVYWRAIISTLAYSGLRLAELAWLRNVDIDFKRGTLTVETVEDGAAFHQVKSANSKRTIEIEPTLLLPRLQAYVKAGHNGASFFFSIPPEKQKVRATGKSERWLVPVLSRRLCKILDTDQTKISARSLRRTFGSLLIRSDPSMTAERVAAVMGNTAAIVKRHYARILPSEIPVRLAKLPEAVAQE